MQEQLIQTIRELSTRIEDSGAAFFIVVGDLFDFPHVTQATVFAACLAIGSLIVAVIEIPRNHDHGGPGSIWEQEFFLREQQQLAHNFQILLKPEPLALESAVIFPTPLLRPHEPGDRLVICRHGGMGPRFVARFHLAMDWRPARRPWKNRHRHHLLRAWREGGIKP